MDERNEDALKRYDEEHVLQKFVNLPDKDGSGKLAEEFCRLYGKLVSPRFRCDEIPARNYYLYVAIFQEVWRAKTKGEKRKVSQKLEGILNRHAFLKSGIIPPPLRVDLTSKPGLGLKIDKDTHLLDLMVWTIVLSRKRLAICKRRNCSFPYFIKPKNTPRRSYCSEECSGRVRKRKKRRSNRSWWRTNRGKGSANV